MVPHWDHPLPDQDCPKIIHIGSGRPRREKIAQSLESRIGIIARQQRRRVQPHRPQPRHAGPIRESPRIAFRPVDPIRIRRQCRERHPLRRQGQRQQELGVPPAPPLAPAGPGGPPPQKEQNRPGKRPVPPPPPPPHPPRTPPPPPGGLAREVAA